MGARTLVLPVAVCSLLLLAASAGTQDRSDSPTLSDYGDVWLLTDKPGRLITFMQAQPVSFRRAEQSSEPVHFASTAVSFRREAAGHDPVFFMYTPVSFRREVSEQEPRFFAADPVSFEREEPEDD